MRLDRAAVQSRDAIDQGQADAQAALGAVEGGLRLHEQIEDARQHVGGDADARVPDRTTPWPSTLDRELMAPAGAVYFAALLSRFSNS